MRMCESCVNCVVDVNKMPPLKRALRKETFIDHKDKIEHLQEGVGAKTHTGMHTLTDAVTLVQAHTQVDSESKQTVVKHAILRQQFDLT